MSLHSADDTEPEQNEMKDLHDQLADTTAGKSQGQGGTVLMSLCPQHGTSGEGGGGGGGGGDGEESEYKEGGG